MNLQELIQIRAEALRLALASNPGTVEEATKRAAAFAQFLELGMPIVTEVVEATEGESK